MERHAVIVALTRTSRRGAWVVDHEIEIDEARATRRARVTRRSPSGSRSTLLEADGAGTWRVDGRAAPHLEGCLDVDLESSALTNALPLAPDGAPRR